MSESVEKGERAREPQPKGNLLLVGKGEVGGGGVGNMATKLGRWLRKRRSMVLASGGDLSTAMEKAQIQKS